MDVVRVGIVGAGGRMGQSLVEELEGFDGLELSAAVEDSEAAALGRSYGAGVEVTADVEAAAAVCDVLVDFSTPEGCLAAAHAAASEGAALVTGTTGLDEAQQRALEALGEEIALLQAANFSVGINVLAALVERASAATDEGFDLEIFEAHHRHKVDAPSGTALALGRAAARGRDLGELEEVAAWARHGHTGPRGDDDIGFGVLRGGDIVGEHTVYLCGAGERLELTHRATDRGIFARGALRAAGWLSGRAAGRYDMDDVLFG
jgi:4-hydroxy-tetrahydrodipicolinate reductase